MEIPHFIHANLAYPGKSIKATMTHVLPELVEISD